jgi:translation initiation factor IF-2
MENIILQSEVIMNLRADAQAHAEGVVMDARLEKGLGVVADCIVRWGNTKRGDVLVVSGTQIAKVKMLSVPVEHVHGRAMVQAIFNVGGSDSGEETVAGLRVAYGHLYKSKAVVDSETVDCHFRVLRDGKLISPAKGETASSLRRVKDLVDSVRRGDECGLGLSEFDEFKVMK